MALYCGLAGSLRGGPLTELPYPAWALFVIPIGLSLPFFYAYSAIFTKPGGLFPDNRATRDHYQQFSIWAGVGTIVALVGFLLYKENPVKNEGPLVWPPVWLVIALVIQVALHLYYGIFLVRKYPAIERPPLRYQLIWPILISIAIPLYISLMLPLSLTWEPLLPLAAFVAYFFVTERYAIPKRAFIVFGGLMIGTGAMAALIWPFLSSSITSFMFAVAVAAYAAVFESWNVTATLTRSARPEDVVIITTPCATITIPTVSRYYYGSFAALIISVFFAALLFTFTSLGSLLLALFAVHSFLAVFLWYLAAPTYIHESLATPAASPSTCQTPRAAVQTSPILLGRKWWLVKMILGCLIFIFLAADFWRGPAVIPTLLFAESVTVTVFITIFNILGFVRNSDFPTLSTDHLLAWYSEDKRRLLKHIFVFEVVGQGVTFGLTSNKGSVLPPMAASRASNAFQLFNVFAFITLLCLVMAYLPRDPKAVARIALQKVLAISITLRLVASAAVGASVICVALLHGTSGASATLAAIPFVFACMGGFAINDYCDARKDAINRPYRAIPSNRLSPRAVLTVGYVCIGLGTILSFAAAKSSKELAVYLAAILGICAYNHVVRYAAAYKGIYTGLLSSLPYVYLLSHYRYPQVFWLFPVAVALFISGRELWMDIHDAEGDRSVGLRTLPIRHGDRVAGLVGIVVQLLGSAILFPIAVTIQQLPLLLLALGTAGLCVVLVVSWSLVSAPIRRYVIYSCWLPMITAIAFFCVGSR